MNKKGFVLAETIIVITVLCVILVVLYGAYNQVLLNVNKKEVYNNTEYMYKTNIIRDYLESTIVKSSYEGMPVMMVCSNNKEEKCYKDSSNSERQELFKFLGAEAVYISMWNVKDLGTLDLSGLEATIQSYIKTIDYEDADDSYRIIVMYKDESGTTYDSTMNNDFQYASLRFGDRFDYE